MKKSTGEILRDLRGEMSMEQLSEILNKKYNLSINKGMISRWENNKTSPDNTYLTAYAKHFDTDLNYIVGLTTEKKRLRNSLSHDKEDEIISKYNLDEYELSEYKKIANMNMLMFEDKDISEEDRKVLEKTLKEIFVKSLLKKRAKEQKETE